jgi:hypothetical protein
MKALEEIQEKLFSGKFEFSRHALKRVVGRNISELEIKEVFQRLIFLLINQAWAFKIFIRVYIRAYVYHETIIRILILLSIKI